jgi:hypothetical protein
MQAEEAAAEAARRATEERARRLAAAGFYPVEQMKRAQEEDAKAAKAFAAREAQDLLDRLRVEEQEAMANQRSAAADEVFNKVTQTGKGFVLKALNFLSDQLDRVDLSSSQRPPPSAPLPKPSAKEKQMEQQRKEEERAAADAKAKADAEAAAKAAEAKRQEEEKRKEEERAAAEAKAKAETDAKATKEKQMEQQRKEEAAYTEQMRKEEERAAAEAKVKAEAEGETKVAAAEGAEEGKSREGKSRKEEKGREEAMFNGEELREAVVSNDVALVKKLCALKDAVPGFADEFGYSCLHLAAKRGYKQVDPCIPVCARSHMSVCRACMRECVVRVARAEGWVRQPNRWCKHSWRQAQISTWPTTME